MFTKTTYKFEKDGVIGLACGYKPEVGEIFEELVILYAEDGYTLCKGGEEVGEAVLLKDGDTDDNYTEKERKEPEENLD